MSTPNPDRRSERTKQAILEATRKLLAEKGGVRALTIEAVAARSGVAKTTIYRRWRDKWELALDAAMIDVLTTFDDPVDVGDTRAELITFVSSAVRTLGSRPYGPALQGLASEVYQFGISVTSLAPSQVVPTPGTVHHKLVASLEDPKGALQGRNSRGQIGYMGPRPPEGDPPHHYHFQVFALDAPLTMPPGADREALLAAMRGHVLARGETVGTFQKRR